jgi:hypothetical protein
MISLSTEGRKCVTVIRNKGWTLRFEIACDGDHVRINIERKEDDNENLFLDV